jgi:thiol-disulfide isomerase/thioredoxin
MTVSFAGCTSSESGSSGESGDMDSAVEDFYIESTLYNFTSNGNEPMIFVTMNNGSDLNWEFVVLHLSVNQENFTSCTNPLDESGSQCHATDDGDGYWSQGETITIREGNENLCDGSHNCNVQIKISESYINVSPIPNMIFESLNRSGVESVMANETGWINLNDHRGDIIILDFMAHDCSNCHAVQEHIEQNMDTWAEKANTSGNNLTIFGYGSWYAETIDYLNETSGAYHVPAYPTGLGSTNAATLEDGSTTDPVRLFTTGGTGQIPVVLAIDQEGYIIAREATGTPADKWAKFDGVLNEALEGDVEDTISSRIAWEEPTLTPVYESPILSI